MLLPLRLLVLLIAVCSVLGIVEVQLKQHPRCVYRYSHVQQYILRSIIARTVPCTVELETCGARPRGHH